jgi:hypothetical protein
MELEQYFLSIGASSLDNFPNRVRIAIHGSVLPVRSGGVSVAVISIMTQGQTFSLAVFLPFLLFIFMSIFSIPLGSWGPPSPFRADGYIHLQYLANLRLIYIRDGGIEMGFNLDQHFFSVRKLLSGEVVRWLWQFRAREVPRLQANFCAAWDYRPVTYFFLNQVWGQI